MESNSMSLEFWPGTDVRRSTHNGFTLGLTGGRPGAVTEALKPHPKARANPGKGVKRAIEQLTLDGESIRVFSSIADAARSAEIPDANIVRVATGVRKTAGGFRWRYPDPAKDILRDRHIGAYSKAAA
jgi:hypothetical protein